MTYIHENGWLLFVVSEGLTWVLVALFLLSRYWLRFDRLSQLWLMFIVGINMFQIFLGGIDFYFTGEISFFQIVIVLFITYACTLGRSDFEKIDRYIKYKFDRRKNNLERSSELVDLYSYLPYRFGLFFLHTVVFALIHYLWFVVDQGIYIEFSNYMMIMTNSWFGTVDYELLTSPLYFVVSYVWSLIYLFEVIVIVMYGAVLFMRKNKFNRLTY